MEIIDQLLESYATYFSGNPAFVVRAPGRVNLIGEHTDYNDGYVLPMAIDRSIWIALSPRSDRMVRARSLDYGSDSHFSLDDLKKGQGWPEYLKGVAFAMQKDGLVLQGWEGVISGNVPRGAGLSSSAAVEMAAARGFAVVSGFEWNILRVARSGQRAENEWIGVNSGIMDQMACAACMENHALFLDCRSLEYQHIPLPENVSVVVMDTSTRRGLAESAYNERRAQCEQAARYFGVKALRDVSLKEFEVAGEKLEDVTRRRVRHIITENQRVLDAVAAMRGNDMVALGQLLNESHISLRDDFEVTNDPLNQIVECAQSQVVCYGARMTGAGFGGCAVALVDENRVQGFVNGVAEDYFRKSGLEAQIYICKASDGANVVPL